MKAQTITWTALPNGFTEDGKLRLSVLVSFRLDTDEGLPTPTLRQFPDLLSMEADFGVRATDWPETVRNARFRVRFGNRVLSAVQVHDENGDPLPDSKLWRTLFDTSTFVRPYVFDDLTRRLVLSYPVMHVHNTLKSYYANLMASVTDELPRAGDLINLTGDQFAEMPSPDELLAQLKKWYGKSGAVPVTQAPDPAADFALLKLFHTPPAKALTFTDPDTSKNLEERATWRTHRRVPLPKPDDFKDLLDFHQRVAALNQYPKLLRKLGLVVDLEVDTSRVMLPSKFPLSVHVAWRRIPKSQSGVDTKNVSPRTRALLTRSEFHAEPKLKDQEVSNGLLRLDSANFDLIQVDVDGLAIKVLNTISSAYRQAGVPKDKQDEMGAPVARSGGLAVVHTGRGQWLAQRLKDGKGLNDVMEGNQPGVLQLFAEDLVRGYYLDVWDDHAKQWRSLCQRIGTYHFVRTGETVKLQDEGIIQVGATQSPDYPDNATADQIYLHETMFDWRGWSLVAPRPGKTIDPEDQVASIPNTPPKDLGLEVNFTTPKGALPRLRLGRKYKMRARLVDLAGNSLAPTTSDIGGGSITTATERYLRFEPVPAPAIALVDDGGLLAPRQGESMDRLAIRSFNDSPDKDDDRTTEVAQRFVLPPRIPQITAESHGMFDLADGTVDKQAYAIITKFDGSLGEKDVNGASYAFGTVPLELPYLPDPLSHHLLVQVLDHKKRPIKGIIVDPIRFYESKPWPEALPFRIVLGEGDSPPRFDEEKRLLEVWLPKAEVVYLRLSALLDEKELDLMGMWEWRKALGSPGNDEFSRAVNGRNWMLTPWRDVALVHATQQPLVIPKLDDLNPNRWLDRTFVELRFVTPVSRKSTAMIDMLAKWNEPVDDPNEPAPTNLKRDDHAFNYKIPLEEPYDELDFREVAPIHELGDTKYRQITYWAEATTRFREYLPPGIAPADLKRVSEPVHAYVPNSARPEAPRVLYVLPTFGWKETAEGDGVTRMRKGGGLRVYMERPWYSCGYGEMLAVVLLASSGNLETLKPFITQWGRDPIWLSAPVAGAAPHRTNFPRARTDLDVDLSELQPHVPSEDYRVSGDPFQVTDLTLPEAPGVKVDVAPHDVGYDPNRRLWYCDIEIDTGPSYFPFIRLALARYHPTSVDGAHLSPVVLADFAQLTPDRSASVIPVAGNPKARRVVVAGPIHSKSSVMHEVMSSHNLFEILYSPDDGWFNNIIEVSVERMDPDIGTDLGWKPVEGATVTKQPISSLLASVLWNGIVELPEASSDKDRHRIVIREYELFAADTETGTEKRPVYVDTIEL